MTKRVSLWCFWYSLAAGMSGNAVAVPEDNEVVVTGENRERHDQNRAGQSVIIRPVDETRFDVSTQFKLDPAISALDQTKPSAGGFSLPLFRGNDIRASHIFLDGIELQDPFTGFPLIEDIDLRGFGELRIHKGVAPWNVSVASPGGVVQFVTRPSRASGGRLGLFHGDVAGTSVWAQGDHRHDSGDLRLYARRHRAQGSYSFYSDNGTIRNRDDDVIRRRDNNDRAADLGSILFTEELSRGSVRAFGWFQQANQGMPAPLAEGDGAARVASQTAVASTSYRHHLSSEVDAGVSLQLLQTHRRFWDAGQDIGRADQRRYTTKTMQGSLFLEQNSDEWSWLVSARRAAVTVALDSPSQEETFDPKEDVSLLYAGALWSPVSWLKFEVKADQWLFDERGNAEASNQSLTAWMRYDQVSGWLQLANMERAPSLFERSGNGAEFLGSDRLVAEKGVFAEIGIRHQDVVRQNWRGERMLTLWAEDMRDRIRMMPISTTQWKALNIDREHYRGIEGRERWRIGICELEGGVSYTKAVDDQGYILPRLSQWQAVVGTGWYVVEHWVARSVSRYQGRMFDDAVNTSEIGDVWIHDLSLDRSSDLSRWAWGAALLNVSDVRWVPVRDVATGQTDGRMAWQSKERNPLPGRQWVVRVSVHI